MAKAKKEDTKENDLIHQQQFTVRIHEINQEKQITIPALLRVLQETSMQHIIRLKASVWDLKEQQISWVLLRKELHILKHAHMGDRITVLTYPTGFDKFFAYRDFLVFDGDRKLIATASTMWSLIDTKTRKLTRVPESLHHLEAPDHIKRLKRPRAIAAPQSILDPTDHRVIRPYDLDWNGHVNNVVLCRYMIESLLQNEAKESDMKVLRFQFKNECHQGEKVDISSFSDSRYVSVDRDGKLICSMEVEYVIS